MTTLIVLEAVLLVGSVLAGAATVQRIKQRRAARARRQGVPA